MKKLCFISLFLAFAFNSAHAQVAINTDASLPDNSAMLDVKSASKGLLIPRIALTGTLDATTIASPATSLLIYNTATAGTTPNNVTPGYYYWNGAAWSRLSVSAGGSGTTNYLPKWTPAGTLGNSLLFDDGSNVGIGTATPGAKLDVAGRIWQTNTGQSVFLGESAGASDNLNNNQNVFIGYQAGKSNTTGYHNMANGPGSLLTNTTGFSNTANGSDALWHNTYGCANTANGSSALYSNTSGNNNTAIGVNALQTNNSGSRNTAIGYSSDVSTIDLVNATAVGAYAVVGQSNSLVLGGTGSYTVNVGIGTTTPSAKLDVMGAVKITDGTQGANKVLTSDVNGLASWQNAATVLPAWLLTGNSGTVPGTNFIGTTDNNAFNIRTNNLLKTRITTKGAIETYNTGQSVFIGEGAGLSDDLNNRQNVFIGYQAGKSNTTGNLNTANGAYALSSNTTGSYNSANGAYALSSNLDGNNNTANGVSALRLNTWGGGNTATGVNVLMANTFGANNTANGVYALTSNTEGDYNTANGGLALTSNTTGYNNTANGYNSLHSNTTGYNNTANGSDALYSNTTGHNNTANGDSALYSNTTGSNNIALGYKADVASNNLVNAIAIGANSVVGQSNSIVLGGTGSYAVNVGIGTTSPAASAALDITSTTKGFLPPRMTSISRDAIASPSPGLVIWCNNCGSTGELQVYNGTSWTNMTGGTASPPFTIGQSYHGGVIAYILQPGDPGYVAGEFHGLIAATSDQSTGTMWALPTYQNQSVPGGTSTAIGTGSANTNNIIAQNGAGSTYAAGLARSYNGGGYSDWFLPSIDELYKLYLNRAAIGGFSDEHYWSSSEYFEYGAWSQYFFFISEQDFSYKFLTYYVRAVRAF